MSVLENLGQISVLWPRMLWLLAPLPVLVAIYVWLGAHRRRTAVRLLGLSGLKATGTPGASVRHAIPPSLFLIGLTALIGAVARPQALILLPSLHKDIVLAIDASGSMRATDAKPNRLGAAQSAARTFVESQPRHSRIGIVSIASSAAVAQSLTDNREDLLQAIERIQLQRGTALGSGIYIALATLLPNAGINLEHLVHGRSWNWNWDDDEPTGKGKAVPAGSNRSAAIVLLSDGENNHGPDPLEAAKLAAKHGIRIYTVGIGSTEGITLGYSGWSMRVRLDEDVLRKIAATTHGEYYGATSAQELKSIYQHLSARMVIERARTVEVTAIFVGAGALLLVISALISVRWFNRVL
jgi:Ca-activated chloride channel family protein